MALIEFQGARVSGKLGGYVFSRNKGGDYARAWVNPTNPNTPQQQTIRSAINQLTARWNDVLTAVQRTAWETYAAAVPVLNRFGTPINITGQAHYNRSNVPRIQVLGAAKIVDAAPTVFNLGEYTAPVITQTATSTCSVAFNESDEWIDEDDSAMLLYASREKNPTVNYFKGPYRLVADQIDGNSTTPPTTPHTGTTPFPVADSNRIFYFARVTRADGRLSAAWRGQDTPSFV